ncbi:hypothetical protein Ciccas_004269 [Cichlidogyrus casuarinus]|uniref:Uncharacterized protein n=1 Tax=Cichlidogyrus casuarinus TaxID=1844966 RepID=A0ABD2QC38_9PLAT
MEKGEGKQRSDCMFCYSEREKNHKLSIRVMHCRVIGDEVAKMNGCLGGCSNKVKCMYRKETCS